MGYFCQLPDTRMKLQAGIWQKDRQTERKADQMKKAGRQRSE